MTTTNSIGSSYPFATADIANDAVTYAKMQPASAGYVLLGNSAAGAADLAEITLGSGLSFAGSVLSATGLTYATVVSTSQSAAVNYGYITNNAGLVTVTLPSTAAVGDVVEVQGLGAGGWKVAQNASQLIRGANGVVTTTGTGGSLASTNQYDFVKLRCIVANTTWAIQSIIGNATVV